MACHVSRVRYLCLQKPSHKRVGRSCLFYKVKRTPILHLLGRRRAKCMLVTSPMKFIEKKKMTCQLRVGWAYNKNIFRYVWSQKNRFSSSFSWEATGGCVLPKRGEQTKPWNLVSREGAQETGARDSQDDFERKILILTA